MRKHVVGVALCILLSGCAFGEEEVIGTKVLARFGDDGQTFEIHADQPVTGSLSARVSGSGVDHLVTAGSISSISNTRYSFDNPVSMNDGSQYTIEVLIDGKTSGSRTFTFLNGDPTTPPSATRPTYTARLVDDDGSFAMDLTGQISMERQLAGLRFDFTGTGSITVEEDGFSMKMTLTEATFSDLDDRTISGRIAGTGTWTIDDPESGTQGSGSITKMTMTFLGAESHVDGSGNMREGEKMRMVQSLEGTIYVDGSEAYMEVDIDDTTWADVETGLDFWSKGTTVSTYTIDGESFTEEETYDEAVADGEEGDPTLSDRLPTEMIWIFPAVPGDVFIADGDDLRIEYKVRAGSPQAVEGSQVQTVVLDGRALSGATGTDVMTFVVSGPFSGLILSESLNIKSDGEEALMEVSLLRVS